MVRGRHHLAVRWRRRLIDASAAVAVAGLSASPALSKPDDHSASIVALVAKVIPTVVSITTMRAVPATAPDPRQASMSPTILEAEGSGFVVDPTGYIATNRHVVDGAYDIDVTFSDGRNVEAKLVWKSPAVDVAFLKVDLDSPLPAVTLAKDRSLKLGERVIAIGNPLGLGISVSSGIVSALNRNIKQSPYDDFIQTDAAINHGSSGGPLFDEAGEVVGMNTALYAAVANGGSEGLGFAIPGADLTFLIDQLKTKRRIQGGWLGVHGQKLTHAMGEALGFPGTYGVIVASIVDASPAARAGLRPGDIIETFDGKTLYDVTTLNRATAFAIGKTAAMDVWRDGKPIQVTADIVEANEPGSEIADQIRIAAPRFASASDLGVALAPMSDELRRTYRLPPSVRDGLVVTEVAPSGEAEASGLRPGDVVMSVQMTPIATAASFDQMIATNARSGRHHVIVLVQASGGERWVTLPIGL